MLYLLLALLSLAITVFSLYRYIRGPENSLYIISAILFVIATIVLGGLFLSGRVNKNEDIHITE